MSAASLFHLAWGRVLGKVTGKEDVVFGTVLFGRMQGEAGVDRAVGLFINTLPVRIQIGAEGVEASIRRTHKLLADLMRHEHASLAVAQRCSRVAGSHTAILCIVELPPQRQACARAGSEAVGKRDGMASR